MGGLGTRFCLLPASGVPAVLGACRPQRILPADAPARCLQNRAFCFACLRRERALRFRITWVPGREERYLPASVLGDGTADLGTAASTCLPL